MSAFPKSPPERDSEYLRWIRNMPCAWCHGGMSNPENVVGMQSSPTEAHHHPREGHGATSMKCSDYRTVPLCGHCHRLCHAKRKPYDRLWLEEQIVGLLIRWIGRTSCQ